MNTLRNFVVIFFLGIVVFLAGVMVGKSMRDNAKNSLPPGTKKVVEIPRQVMPVAPLTQDGNSGEIPAKPPVKESLPLPLATAAADNQAAGEQGREGLPEHGKAKSDEKIKYTFYESLTNKKTETTSLYHKPAAKKVLEPIKEKKPTTGMKEAGKVEESTGGKGLVLQVASYPQEGKARLFRNTLVQEGYGKVVVVAARIPGKGTWYRVRIVEIKDKKAAKSLQDRLRKQKKIRSIIVQ